MDLVPNIVASDPVLLALERVIQFDVDHPRKVSRDDPHVLDLTIAYPESSETVKDSPPRAELRVRPHVEKEAIQFHGVSSEEEVKIRVKDRVG